MCNEIDFDDLDFGEPGQEDMVYWRQVGRKDWCDYKVEYVGKYKDLHYIIREERGNLLFADEVSLTNPHTPEQVEEEAWAGSIPSDCEVWEVDPTRENYHAFESLQDGVLNMADVSTMLRFNGFLYQLANGVYHVCSFYPAWTGGGSCFSASYPETTKAPLIGAVMQKSNGEV